MIGFDRVSVSFGATEALEDVTLSVAPGALCVLVGPSGSGKSTLLRLVNRLVEPTAGRVSVRGTDVTALEPAQLRRSIGYVIQSVGLFPHRSVAENIATVPRLLGWERRRIDARVTSMLDLVRLGEEYRERYPAELSGGQAQRVGLARALAADPDILLMDEPFGAVDPITRGSLREELRRIHQKTGKTVLLVTHDPIEALELATQIVVLRGGRMVAAGTPMELMAPAGDPFIRDLFGGELLALRRLRFTPVAAIMEPPQPGAAPGIPAATSLWDALTRMIDQRAARLAVNDESGGVIGSVSLRALVERHP